MKKKILTVLSEYGYWGEELIGPLETLESADYTIDFATPKGRRAHALPPSMDPKFFDPPLGKSVTSPEMAEKVKEIEESTCLDNPINLSKLLPERPYPSSSSFIREFERYNDAVDATMEKLLGEYAALLLVGGSGPIVDMVNNQRLHDLILGFYKADRPIAAECYGVACLAFARDYHLRKSIIWGKHVTGHPIEYDYHDGTGFLGSDLNMGPPPYTLEYILRDATGPDGGFHGNVGRNVSALVDYPFITGRSMADSYKTGELLVAALEKGLRRYGW
ncbi:MAG: type 1 glutamine amidotransferase domain-containing protein [Opitutaceae bacterium]|jgi:putative intracellular protease/amidase